VGSAAVMEDAAIHRGWQCGHLDYTFNARIDTGSMLRFINLVESGSFEQPVARQ